MTTPHDWDVNGTFPRGVRRGRDGQLYVRSAIHLHSIDSDVGKASFRFQNNDWEVMHSKGKWVFTGNYTVAAAEKVPVASAATEYARKQNDIGVLLDLIQPE